MIASCPWDCSDNTMEMISYCWAFQVNQHQFCRLAMANTGRTCFFELIFILSRVLQKHFSWELIAIEYSIFWDNKSEELTCAEFSPWYQKNWNRNFVCVSWQFVVLLYHSAPTVTVTLFIWPLGFRVTRGIFSVILYCIVTKFPR